MKKSFKATSIVLVGLFCVQMLVGCTIFQKRNAYLEEITENIEKVEPLEEKEVATVNLGLEDIALPESFDLRNVGRTSNVEDQGDAGVCWAIAGLTAVESYLLPEEELDFSTEHMVDYRGFSLIPEEGGSYIMAMAYLTAWEGPVAENNGEAQDEVVEKHVQEVWLPKNKDYDTIKKIIYLYGGVETSLYVDFSEEDAESVHYSTEQKSYYYSGNEVPNHEVVIVGWDNNYSGENFSIPAECDGAFICQNSWGNEFGEDGFFYVSYADTNVGSYNVAYTKVEAADNYDYIYQTDLCGWCGQLGYSVSNAWYSNVYEAKADEIVRGIGLYTTGKNAKYKVYVVEDFIDVESLDTRDIIVQGELEEIGYYTIELPETVTVDKGEKFAVVIQIDIEGEAYPIPIECKLEEIGTNIDLSDGEGYISPDGNKWESTEEEYECNVCLKVYTDLR